MKLAFIFHCLGAGGTEKILLQLIEHYISQGHDCFLILFYSNDNKFVNKLPKRLKIMNLNVKISNTFDFYKVFKLSKKISKIFNEIKPDISYSALWINNIVNILACKKSKRKIKCIISDHINTYASLHYEICCKILYPIKKLITVYLYKKADCIITVSEEGKQDLISLLGDDIKSKIKVIYNGINIKKILTKSNEKVEDINGKYIISVGRISKEKRYELLLKPFSKLPTKNIKLLIVGSDPDPKKIYTKYLKKIAKKLKIHDRVIFLEHKENPYKYMKKAQCLVLSSLYEGFPLVLLEALLVGCPVISARCKTGPEEILASKVKENIEFTQHGILIDAKKHTYLRIALSNLINNPNLRKIYINSATEIIKKEFSVSNMLKKYDLLFEKILKDI